MAVGQICTRSVDTAELTESVHTAAQRMHARNVGTLVVVDKDRRPLGIVTDRDLMVRTLVECCDPVKARVWEVMSQLPQTVNEETTTDEALGIMRSGPYRRLPVVNREGHLVGLVSLDDVLTLVATEFGEISKLLRQQSPESLASV
jgi:CBS domain-containing protein